MAAAVAGVKAIAAAVIESVVAVAVKASAVLGLITSAEAVVDSRGGFHQRGHQGQRCRKSS